MTKIEWCEESLNPLKVQVRQDAAQIARDHNYTSLVEIAAKNAGKVGWHCEHAHFGCDHCYAEAMNGRCLPGCGTGLPYDRRSRDLVQCIIDEKALMQPLKWKKPKSIFWCSMTDMFGAWVPYSHIDKCFAVMAESPQHQHIILTKRPLAMRKYHERYMLESQIGYEKRRLIYPEVPFLDGEDAGFAKLPIPNVILGASASDQSTHDAAAPHLRALAAAGWKTVWSLEPLLGPVDLRLGYRYGLGPSADGFCDHEEECDCNSKPSWLIVGGESGPGARPCDVQWILNIVRQCRDAQVPCFVKQVTHGGKKLPFDEWPDDLRVRELPEVMR